jgi:hypothetical protein
MNKKNKNVDKRLDFLESTGTDEPIVELTTIPPSKTVAVTTTVYETTGSTTEKLTTVSLSKKEKKRLAKLSG